LEAEAAAAEAAAAEAAAVAEAAAAAAADEWGWRWRQGLTLVHFSAQPEPFLSLIPCNYPHNITKGAYVELKRRRV